MLNWGGEKRTEWYVQGNLIWIKEIIYISRFGEGNGTPLQYSCLENPMDGGAW